ncbi:MAG: hydantoinase/oxoprolinase family protein [Clostridia bacterium]|nr:hydantoinase/oxoprolinase family protein [Clostridia bacterium]
MRLGIGIDTGGTYTDAVLYNFEDKSILGSAKSLTTKNDLSIGILGAIDGLPADLVRQADVISLSTTLATNACVEDKGGQAKLIFFGGDKTIIDRNGKQYGLPPSDEICIQESYTTFSGESKREPDWERFEHEIEHGFDHLDGVGILEMNSMKDGAAVEKKAKEIFQKKHNIPVVCGHELFSELNSLKRGASTLLNAGLFPVISEFLESVKKALAVRDIHPSSLVIVRSDGSLMSEEFASLRPVETLLCGPAASALGCTGLTDAPNCIVVDMGGTTTDIAFIRDSLPVTITNGISIGRWKTFVSGLYVKTFGLGGDSAVHYNGRKLHLEEYRVTPLCVAAASYPSVTENLRKLEVKKHTRFLYEHYMLIKDIENNSRYTEDEQAFCRALKEKPLLITDAAAAVGKDMYSLKVDRLIKDGVVQLCGFTPTDVMHLRGDFDRYDSEASRLAAEFIAHNLDVPVETVCDRVYDEVKKKMYVNIVTALLENKYPDYMKNGINEDVERFILNNYEAYKNGSPDELFSTMFRTNYTLVGMGAPIRVFLEDVADMLGTRAVVPEYHEVANALGAVVGNVRVTCTVEIRPDNSAEGTYGYTVFGKDGKQSFEKLNDAVDFAVTEAETRAADEAKRRGAVRDIEVTSEVHTDGAETKEGNVYLGTFVTAHAFGSMGF